MSKNTTETKGDRDDHARAGKVTVEEARVHLSRFNSSHFHRHAPGPHGRAVYSIPANPWRDSDIRLGAFITRAAHAFDAIARVSDVLKHDGCSCDCDHDSESHDEDCDRCLACRIGAAIGDAS